MLENQLPCFSAKKKTAREGSGGLGGPGALLRARKFAIFIYIFLLSNFFLSFFSVSVCHVPAAGRNVFRVDIQN